MFWTGHLQKIIKLTKHLLRSALSSLKSSLIAQWPLVGQGLLIITYTHHIRSLLWRVNSLMQRPLPDNTQHSQEIDIHAPSGIQTRNPSKWVTTDPCLRPSSHYAGPLSKYSCKLFRSLCMDSAFLCNLTASCPFPQSRSTNQMLNHTTIWPWNAASSQH